MYRIYINCDYVWNINEITPNMEEKHIGEFETIEEAEKAIKRNKEWLLKLGYIPECFYSIMI